MADSYTIDLPAYALPLTAETLALHARAAAYALAARVRGRSDGIVRCLLRWRSGRQWLVVGTLPDDAARAAAYVLDPASGAGVAAPVGQPLSAGSLDLRFVAGPPSGAALAPHFAALLLIDVYGADADPSNYDTLATEQALLALADAIAQEGAQGDAAALVARLPAAEAARAQALLYSTHGIAVTGAREKRGADSGGEPRKRVRADNPLEAPVVQRLARLVGDAGAAELAAVAPALAAAAADETPEAARATALRAHPDLARALVDVPATGTLALARQRVTRALTVLWTAAGVGGNSLLPHADESDDAYEARIDAAVDGYLLGTEFLARSDARLAALERGDGAAHGAWTDVWRKLAATTTDTLRRAAGGRYFPYGFRRQAQLVSTDALVRRVDTRIADTSDDAERTRVLGVYKPLGVYYVREFAESPPDDAEYVGRLVAADDTRRAVLGDWDVSRDPDGFRPAVTLTPTIRAGRDTLRPTFARVYGWRPAPYYAADADGRTRVIVMRSYDGRIVGGVEWAARARRRAVYAAADTALVEAVVADTATKLVAVRDGETLDEYVERALAAVTDVRGGDAPPLLRYLRKRCALLAVRTEAADIYLTARIRGRYEYSSVWAHQPPPEGAKRATARAVAGREQAFMAPETAALAAELGVPDAGAYTEPLAALFARFVDAVRRATPRRQSAAALDVGIA